MATCTVSGTLKDITETGIIGATVRAFSTGPFTSGTNYITNGTVSTTTDSSGNWSLVLTQTAGLSPVRNITIEFIYNDGGSGTVRESYPVTIPATSTATFTSLITLP